jgi:AcrR family transcriptional regulator
MTLYRHYASKDELVIGFLRQRGERWTQGWLRAGIERHGGSAAERLLVVFDLFDAWFRRDDFEGCPFINVMLESGGEPGHAVRRAAVEQLAEIRALLRTLAAEAGAKDPEALARQWHILMNGCIVAACQGDSDAARRAKEVARLLLPPP